MGAECIKVYNTLGRTEFEVIEEEARALGLPLLGSGCSVSGRPMTGMAAP